MAGSHDKSEWILYKSDNLNVEIAASRDDNVNKTTCPKDILKKLEPSTKYTLTLRYHDANDDVWSDKGSIEFTTKDKFFKPNPSDPTTPYVPTSGIKFKVAQSFSNNDFFINGSTTGKNGKIYHNWVSPSDFIVEINGLDSGQSLFSITANTGDTVLIKPKREGVKFPVFNTLYGGSSEQTRSYISEILEPFPTIWETDNQQATTFKACFYNCANLTSIPENLFFNNTQVTSFLNCFYNCRNLTSVPENLFANNTQVTNFINCFLDCTSLTSVPENLFFNNTQVIDFINCFRRCTGLTSIPENLFFNNTQVTNFERCFQDCTSLTSVPENLFANNTQVTSFYYCFRDCTNLTINNLRITARNVTTASYFAYQNHSRATVRVPRGSTTSSSFRNSNANCNVIEVDM